MNTETTKGPKGIPFGQRLTCDNCSGYCTDHYRHPLTNELWCPECAGEFLAEEPEPKQYESRCQCGATVMTDFKYRSDLFSCDNCNAEA